MESHPKPKRDLWGGYRLTRAYEMRVRAIPRDARGDARNLPGRLLYKLRATQQRTRQAETNWLATEVGLAPGEAQMGRMQPHTYTETLTVSVNEALAAERRLVVLGDPGSGKTTLLRYLALLYARDLAEEANLVRQNLSLTERGHIPILFPLRRLGAYLKAHHAQDDGLDGHAHLLEHLLEMLKADRIMLPEDFFDAYLETGRAIILLDGLDEIADPDLRRRVARMVEAFTAAYPTCRYVVTSRIVGYSGAARLGEGYSSSRVRDFSTADIEKFLYNWQLTVAVRQMGANEDAQIYAEQQTQQLLVAIDTNERIRELAINPLMLTVIALVHRDRVKLPDRRAELYAEAVDVLLGKWDAARGVPEIAVLGNRPFDAKDKQLLLQQIALAMHIAKKKEISVEELRRLTSEYLHRILTDWREVARAIDRFLRVIEERAGLLTARGEGTYGFSHLTFQEYLTALAVATRDDYVKYTLKRCGDPWWREVILLETGHLSLQNRERTAGLIKAIAHCKKEPELYHNLVLAAECIRDVGESRVGNNLATEIQQKLHEEFEIPMSVSLLDKTWRWLGRKPTQNDVIQRRALAATALARIENGDAAGLEGFWTRPYGEPTWVKIPASSFWMGTPRDDMKSLMTRYGGRREWYERETPQHKIPLESYWIARTPVSNAQYRLFVEATQHTTQKHWEDGRVPKGLESHPVVNVNWHEAMAYCKWLGEVTGKHVTLPSEAEWEKAARGSADCRAYPWGEEWQPGYCNTEELKVKGTTPVGIFPEGASPYGCLDMAGNVWEWTRSLCGICDKENSKESLRFPYPYNATDGREDLLAEDNMLRALRGGSFNHYQGGARCACRIWRDANYSGWLLGFRVVISPAPTERNKRDS